MSEEECSPSKLPRLGSPEARAMNFAQWMRRRRASIPDHRPPYPVTPRSAFPGLKLRHGEEEKKQASCVKQIINQLSCDERYSSHNPVKVTILAGQWKWPWDWWSSPCSPTILRQLSKQLAKFPKVKVSFLVPKGSCSHWDMINAEHHNVTIVEAKEQHGFNDPMVSLSYPPEDLSTDIVIGLGERLNKMAQLFKERHHCKSIFFGGDAIDESLSKSKQLRDALAKSEEEITSGYSVQPIMEIADLPVAVGPKMADKLSASLSHQKKRVFEFTPGILHEFADVTHTPCDRKKFRIMVAGHGNARHFQKERLNIVAHAVARLKDESYEIIYVGAAQGEQKEFVEKFHECGVAKHQLNIRSPPKDEEEMKRWLCEADLAIMPSSEQEFEMFGLTALSSGLPILVHSASGFGEALKRVIGGSPSIVESEDFQEWSKTIKKVRDKNRKVRLEEAVLLRKHYSEMYSWENQCGALVDEMLKMISGPQDQTQKHGF